MRILNLYANIGGNRKLWGDEHQITAVELNPKIAAIYQEFWPKDTVVVADAHQYLLDHFSEFDFIWSSPPCPTHSKMNLLNSLSPYKDNTKQLAHGGGIKPRYADMTLYQEIIFLKHHYKGKWCVENVISYYEPLIKPLKMSGHYFWTNFYMPVLELGSRQNGAGGNGDEKEAAKRMGFDIQKYTGIDKCLAIRDCTNPLLGKHILEWSQKEYNPRLFV